MSDKWNNLQSALQACRLDKEKLQAEVERLRSDGNQTVSLDTVGHEWVMKSPYAHRAVRVGISKDDFIKHLLKVVEDQNDMMINKMKMSTLPVGWQESNDKRQANKKED